MKKILNLEKNNEKSIVSSGNDVYFYDEINRENVLRLRLIIESINKDFDNFVFSRGMFKRLYDRITNKIYGLYINLHIHSYGGDVDSSLNVADFIETNRYPIVTIAEGDVASGATLMHQAGYERWMNNNCFYLIHQIRGGMGGNHKEMEDQMKNWKLFEKAIVNFYTKRSRLDEEFVKMMLDNEQVIDSETALDYGLVDRII